MAARHTAAPSLPSGGEIGVLVIASVALYREGIVGALAARGRFDILGSAGTTDEIRDTITVRRPDVVVIDAAAPRSFDIVRYLRVEAPSIKIVAFGIDDCDSDILACAEAGIHGYVLRDGSMDDLVRAITSTIRGEIQCPPRVAASLFRRLAALAGSRDTLPRRWVGLTTREREVLTLLDAGLSNKQIASELRIGVSTVKNHVHRVLEKLHVDSRSAAVASLRVGLSERAAAALPQAPPLVPDSVLDPGTLGSRSSTQRSTSSPEPLFHPSTTSKP
jgi:DNA-binding NarL/FixJ family response regulator